jgi:uncharacterized protein YggL (DUF469 family)
MGNISFLTGGAGGPPQSVAEAIYQLENSSLIFLAAWQKNPPEFQRAHRASQDAMALLDHIVNEILRARDHLKQAGTYSGSALEAQLCIARAMSVDSVTRAQQLALAAARPRKWLSTFNGNTAGYGKAFKQN